MNEEIKIVLNVDGLEKNLTNTKALKKEFQNLSNDAKKSLNEIGKEAKEAFGGIEKGSKGLSVNLDRTTRSISSKLGGVLKSFSEQGQKAFSDLAGAKGINDLASVLASFGPYGAAAAVGIQAVTFAWEAYNAEAKAVEASKKAVIETTDGIVASALQEVSSLNALETVMLDVNSTYSERSGAIDEIQSKYGKYIGNIQLETLSLQDQARALELIKKRIIENSIQKGIESEQSKRLESILQAQIKKTAAEREIAALRADNSTITAGGVTINRNQTSQTRRDINRLTEEINEANKAIAAAQREYNQLAATVNEVTQATKDAVGISTGFSDVFFNARVKAAEIADEANKKAKKEAKTTVTSIRQVENAATQSINNLSLSFKDLDKSISNAFNQGKLETANNLLGDRQKLIEQSIKELSKFGNNELVSKFIADLKSQQIDFTLNFAGFRKNLSGEIEKAFKDSYKTAVDAAIKSGDLSFETFEKISIEKSNEGLNTIVSNAENVATKLNSTFETSLIDINGTAITFNEAIAKTLLDAGKLTQLEFDQIKNFAAQTNDAIVFAEKTAIEERSEIQQNFGKFLLDVLKRKTDKEIANLNSQKEIELATVGDNEEEKFRIQNEYAIKVAELRLKDAQDVQARGGDVINYIKELEAEILRLKNESNAKQKTSANKNAENEQKRLDEIEKKRKEGIQKTIDSSFDLLKNSFDLIDTFVSFGQEKIDRLGESISEIDAQIQESQERQREISAILNEEEGARFAAAAAALDFQKQREEELAAQKIALEQAKFAEEQKLARRRKAIAISEAVASAAQSLINIFAAPSIIPEPFNTAFKATQAASVVAVTTAQIAKISKEKFDVGGFTGDGEGKPDSSGFKMAGIVHEGEWVAPKWMVESPRFAESIQRLESERVRGFANGGFTDFNANSNALTQSNQLAAAFEKYAAASIKMANRPVIANASEFANVQKTQAKVLSLTTI